MEGSRQNWGIDARHRALWAAFLHSQEGAPVSIKIVQFTNAATKEPILVNVDHVRIAHQVPGHDRVKLFMDGAQAVDVEGDLRTVQAC